MKRWVILGTALLAILYVTLAIREADRRETVRPKPAPIGVTVNPGSEVRLGDIQSGGFDFVTIYWNPSKQPETVDLVRRIISGSGLKYAFLVQAGGSPISKPDRDNLAVNYSGGKWQQYRGKPVLYSLGKAPAPPDDRFTIIRLDNGPGGDQYWVSNPPNWKNRLLTLTPSYTYKNVRIDPKRTGKALEQQELFAETYKDRVDLLLWHSWNVAYDKSGLALPGADTLRNRVVEFNEKWKRP